MVTRNPPNALLLVVILSSSLVAGGSRKRVIIHVPLHIKHHHHTHTIFKHVKHHERHHHDHHHDHHLHAPYGGHDSYKLYSYSLGHRHAPPPDFAPTSGLYSCLFAHFLIFIRDIPWNL